VLGLGRWCSPHGRDQPQHAIAAASRPFHQTSHPHHQTFTPTRSNFTPTRSNFTVNRLWTVIPAQAGLTFMDMPLLQTTIESIQKNQVRIARALPAHCLRSTAAPLPDCKAFLGGRDSDLLSACPFSHLAYTLICAPSASTNFQPEPNPSFRTLNQPSSATIVPPPTLKYPQNLSPPTQERFWQMLRREMQQFDEVLEGYRWVGVGVGGWGWGWRVGVGGWGAFQLPGYLRHHLALSWSAASVPESQPQPPPRSIANHLTIAGAISTHCGG